MSNGLHLWKKFFVDIKDKKEAFSNKSWQYIEQSVLHIKIELKVQWNYVKGGKYEVLIQILI